MPAPKNLSTLAADKPVADPKDDRLGYAPFAKHLAENICKMSPADGFVVAIYGPWGSGKTTVLNFVRYYLQQLPESEQPIIVPFNPWWFSGHEDLTRRFFEQLQATLNKRKSIVKDLTNRIADFADAVSETPVPYASTGKAVARLLGPKQKDVPGLKMKVADALKKQQRRILVIVDDIDRLTAEETRQLFRVIKAVADFPNTAYLLAFDKEVVIKALTETQGIPGEEYLEKIIQVPFELPLPDKVSLRQLLFEKLNTILADTPEQLFDQTDFLNIYYEGTDHFITTPRYVVRLTNTLTVTYPAVRGEVNAADFIGIETLRVFCPTVYDIIRKDPEAFAGHTDRSGLRRFSLDDLKHFHESWMKAIPEGDVKPIKRLLMRIFPKLKAVWENHFYGADFQSTWRRQRRVCSPEVFPIYFRLSIPEGDISDAEMKTILALASDANSFGTKLVELSNQVRPDGTTRVRAFLERLVDYTEKEIPLDCIPSIVQALFEVGDKVLRPEDEGRGMLGFLGNEWRIGWVLWPLMRRLDHSKRFEVLKEAISSGKAIATIMYKIRVLGRQHGKYGAEKADPEEERLITAQHLEELEALALEKVRDAAQQDFLLQVPKLLSILACWRNWGGEEEVRQWVQKAINNDKELVELLEKFLQKTFSQSVSDVVGRVNYRLDPQWLEPFLDPSQVIDRVRDLAEANWLTENQKTAINQFIREYEMREQGKNPNSLLAWKDE